jgi:DNA polymerase elongation subunit (family B)
MKFYTNVVEVRNEIYHAGYNDGVKFAEYVEYTPTLGLENPAGNYRSLKNKKLSLKNFDSIREMRDYKNRYSDSLELYNDISPVYQFISDEYTDLKYNKNDISIYFYDIEVIDVAGSIKGFPKPEDALVEIVCIAVKDVKYDLVHLFSTVYWDEKKSIINEKVEHHWFEDETELLKGFCNFFAEYPPDLLVGYNNSNFDDPYLLHRIDRILGKKWLKKLSPVGVVSYSFKEYQGQVHCNYYIKGIQVLDYLVLYKKFISTSRESFKLSYIAETELGKDKIQYEEFDNIREFYLNDPQKFQDYNITDVLLLVDLDKKLSVLELVFTVAYMAKINFADVLSPIRTWDVMIYNYLRERNILIPPSKTGKLKQSFPGAYVHEPETGVYDWVVSFDLNSLYPHLIMNYNMSYETIINELECTVNQKEIDSRFFTKELDVNPDFILGGAGYYFDKKRKGLFPVMMENLYKDRKSVKKSMLELKKKLKELPSLEDIEKELKEIDTRLNR